MRVILLGVVGLLFALPIFAQDVEATEEPSIAPTLWTIVAGGEVTYDCFGSTATYDPVEDYDADTLPKLALVPVSDGSWLFVQAGADYLFTPTTDGLYSASLIDPEGVTTFEGTMEFVTDDALRIEGELIADPDCKVTGTTLFGQIENADVSVWTESARTFTDVTFFNECLGRSGADATGTAWAASDLLAVLIETEDGLTLDTRVFSGTDGEYLYEDRDESATVTAYDGINLNGVLEEGVLTVNHFYQINDRADCQVEYKSEYVLFDGDLDALIERLPE